MIHVAGSFEREYLFPAPRAAAFAYYANFPGIVPHLPQIALAKIMAV